MTWFAHRGPHECGQTACEIPGCNASRYACCSHCPAEYRRRQAEQAEAEARR